MICCDYLNIQHPALRASLEAKTLAANLLFEIALSCSKRFRLQFDRGRLLHTLGESSFAALLPNIPKTGARKAPLDEQDEVLDRDRILLLQRVLSFGEEGWTDCPLNYIEQVTLYDSQSKVLLRATDGAEFILFALPFDKRAQLLDRYKAAGIPSDVVEIVNVDIEQNS